LIFRKQEIKKKHKLGNKRLRKKTLEDPRKKRKEEKTQFRKNQPRALILVISDFDKTKLISHPWKLESFQVLARNQQQVQRNTKSLGAHINLVCAPSVIFKSLTQPFKSLDTTDQQHF
jgi:hypothetical protein